MDPTEEQEKGGDVSMEEEKNHEDKEKKEDIEDKEKMEEEEGNEMKKLEKDQDDTVMEGRRARRQKTPVFWSRSPERMRREERWIPSRRRNS